VGFRIGRGQYHPRVLRGYRISSNAGIKEKGVLLADDEMVLGMRNQEEDVALTEVIGEAADGIRMYETVDGSY